MLFYYNCFLCCTLWLLKCWSNKIYSLFQSAWSLARSSKIFFFFYLYSDVWNNLLICPYIMEVSGLNYIVNLQAELKRFALTFWLFNHYSCKRCNHIFASEAYTHENIHIIMYILYIYVYILWLMYSTYVCMQLYFTCNCMQLYFMCLLL